MITRTTIESPLGPMLASAEDGALTGLWFVGQQYFPKNAAEWRAVDGGPVFAALRTQLREYFDGTRTAFDVPLNPGGKHGTAFQRDVWNAIAAVPFGRTTTYASLAGTCGKPTAARAAGAATGRNPISLLIPCHRIVGSSGALTGYAGGLERKRALLALERGQRELLAA
jgi:methylated-DNA-[protein]-cysteine S-methyltransferase